MKQKLRLVGVLCVLLSSLVRTAGAAPNPVSSDYVQLSSKAWAAACTSGAPSSPGGCFGNIASPGFAQINRILLGFTDQVNVPVVNTPNSVFIQQYNGSSTVPSTAGQSPQVSVVTQSGTGGASCGYFTTNGGNLTPTGALGQNGTGNWYSFQYFATGHGYASFFYIADSNSHTPVVVTYYVLCVGSDTNVAGNPIPVSLIGTRAN